MPPLPFDLARPGPHAAAHPSRREMIRIGALGLGGLGLADLLRLDRRARAGEVGRTNGRAKSAIVLFLSGGPAHMDMWDPKPDAPEAIRGTFRPIETVAPGIRVCEHLPGMARVADRYAILRAVHHRQADHPAAAYWMMVGSPIARPARNAGFMSREDRPHPGSAAAMLLGPTGDLPPFVMVPEAIQPNGPERSGQFAGFLGAAFDPYRINSDPNGPDYSPGAVTPAAGLTVDRIAARRGLLDEVAGPDGDDLAWAIAGAGHDVDVDYARAFDLIGSPAARAAFDIAAEPDRVRDRYGRHVFGQNVLLARRMIEAGVRLVHVNWVRHDGGKGGQGYDSHRDHLSWSERELLPPTDAAFTALIEDLDARGLLDETLVILMGEFGRTPRFNAAGGRDHWPHCFSVVLAGGGIRGGTVLGASDRLAAYPAADPVTPEDIIATLYQCLGIAPGTLIRDQQDRPFPLVDGTPIHALL